jgi:hypothetical protein
VIGSIKVEALVLGLCLVGLGLVWTLANLGHLDLLATLRRWWPASLVLWGMLELVAAWTHRERAGRS